MHFFYLNGFSKVYSGIIYVNKIHLANAQSEVTTTRVNYGIPGKLFSISISPPSQPNLCQPVIFFSVPITLQLWDTHY